ncbi:MAG: acetyl-CoA acetyltransferase, partial [Actinobacteria bacterium]|nr:acetyl-CoA acetyltransferase [Actinomycetota bacterium]
MPDPTTPVLIGAGTATQRFDDPLAGVDAMGLMRAALDAAVDDAGGSARSLLDRVDEIAVPEGIWHPTDPGRLVLDGRSPGARTVLAAIGVLQQSLFTRAAASIRDGSADVVVVVGGEAKWRQLRGQITGVPAPETGPDGATPDVRLAPASDVLEHLEIHRSLASPTHQYAVMESAIRHAAGRSPGDHARHVAGLVSSLSQVAAGNPDAWNRTAMTVDEVLAAPLVTEPYTKPACSQWNVDQAAAFVLCSAATAEAVAVPRDRWVFPVAGAESNLMVPMTQRGEVHRSPAAVEVGRALAAAAGRPLGELELLEVYSCFPSAVQMQAEAFGIDLDARPFSVTGGMHFAGGP